MVRTSLKLMIAMAFLGSFLSLPRSVAGVVELPGGGVMRLELQLRPDRPQPVVGEMVEVTIRAVYDLKIANERLEIKAGEGFDWIQIRPDRWSEQQIDGLPRIVMERDLAVWPKQAGLLHFGPVSHKLTVIDRQSQRQDITVTAKPIGLSVGEFPALHGWHMTAGKLEVSETLDGDPGRLADGQVLTRQIRLRASGALPEHLPPRPVVSENWLITFAPPPEKRLILTEEGPVAEVLWTWQFRPHTGEPGVLEPVPIPYFDTVTRRIESKEIPALPLAYASFFTGQVPVGRILAPQKLAFAASLAGASLAGLLFALIWLMPPRGRRAWSRLGARLNPVLRARLRAAQRRGDLRRARRLAARIGLGGALVARLDQGLYARPLPGASAAAQDLTGRQGTASRPPGGAG